MQSNTRKCSECTEVIKPVDLLGVFLCISLLGIFTLSTYGAWESWTGFPPVREGKTDWTGIIAYIIFGGLSLWGGLAVLKKITVCNIIGRAYYAFLEDDRVHTHKTPPLICEEGPFLGRYAYSRHAMKGDDKREGRSLKWKNTDWTELPIHSLVFQFRAGGIFRRNRIFGVDKLLNHAYSWKLRSWSGDAFTLIKVYGCGKVSSISLQQAIWIANNYGSVSQLVDNLWGGRRASDNIGSIVAETLETLGDKSKWRSPQAASLRQSIESTIEALSKESLIQLRIPEWERIAKEKAAGRAAGQAAAPAEGGEHAVASA